MTSIKQLSLSLLTLQNICLSLLFHSNRSLLNPNLIVLLCEILKGLISLSLVFILYPSDLSQILKSGLKLLIPPAALYVAQNTLQHVASSRMEITVFLLTYQAKILITAALSVLLLNRSLRMLQWIALAFLTIGVGFVQLPNERGTGNVDLLGLAAVLGSCLTSGLAGVYFEWLVKHSSTKKQPTSLWAKNVQMSICSMPFALAPFIGNSKSIITQVQNINSGSLAVVLVQSAGGIITALVVKYADNILKNFASAISILGTFLITRYVPRFKSFPQQDSIGKTFFVGAALVLAATGMYSYSAPPSSAVNSGKLGVPPAPYAEEKTDIRHNVTQASEAVKATVRKRNNADHRTKNL